jgi:hypothetical protein
VAVTLHAATPISKQLVWTLTKSAWTLNILAGAVVVWRLYSAELHRVYRFFFASLVFGLLRSAALFLFSPRSASYYRIWASTEPILWLFYVAVVFEIYSLVLSRYAGIYSVGRMFFFAAVAVSTFVSALTVFPTMTGALAARPLLYYYALIERSVVTSLAIFLLLLLALVTWFPVPLSRNLLVHCSVYSAYFFAGNVIGLFWHIGGMDAHYWTSMARFAVAMPCYYCWAFLLSGDGEHRTASLHLGRSPMEEERLLGQLDGLNATLLRGARHTR